MGCVSSSPARKEAHDASGMHGPSCQAWKLIGSVELERSARNGAAFLLRPSMHPTGDGSVHNTLNLSKHGGSVYSNKNPSLHASLSFAQEGSLLKGTLDADNPSMHTKSSLAGAGRAASAPCPPILLPQHTAATPFQPGSIKSKNTPLTLPTSYQAAGLPSSPDLSSPNHPRNFKNSAWHNLHGDPGSIRTHDHLLASNAWKSYEALGKKPGSAPPVAQAQSQTGDSFGPCASFTHRASKAHASDSLAQSSRAGSARSIVRTTNTSLSGGCIQEQDSKPMFMLADLEGCAIEEIYGGGQVNRDEEGYLDTQESSLSSMFQEDKEAIDSKFGCDREESLSPVHPGAPGRRPTDDSNLREDVWRGWGHTSKSDACCSALSGVTAGLGMHCSSIEQATHRSATNTRPRSSVDLHYAVHVSGKKTSAWNGSQHTAEEDYRHSTGGQLTRSSGLAREQSGPMSTAFPSRSSPEMSLVSPTVGQQRSGILSASHSLHRSLNNSSTARSSRLGTPKHSTGSTPRHSADPGRLGMHSSMGSNTVEGLLQKEKPPTIEDLDAMQIAYKLDLCLGAPEGSGKNPEALPTVLCDAVADRSKGPTARTSSPFDTPQAQAQAQASSAPSPKPSLSPKLSAGGGISNSLRLLGNSLKGSQIFKQTSKDAGIQDLDSKQKERCGKPHKLQDGNIKSCSLHVPDSELHPGSKATISGSFKKSNSAAVPIGVAIPNKDRSSNFSLPASLNQWANSPSSKVNMSRSPPNSIHAHYKQQLHATGGSFASCAGETLLSVGSPSSVRDVDELVALTYFSRAGSGSGCCAKNRVTSPSKSASCHGGAAFFHSPLYPQAAPGSVHAGSAFYHHPLSASGLLHGPPFSQSHVSQPVTGSVHGRSDAFHVAQSTGGSLHGGAAHPNSSHAVQPAGGSVHGGTAFSRNSLACPHTGSVHGGTAFTQTQGQKVRQPKITGFGSQHGGSAYLGYIAEASRLNVAYSSPGPNSSAKALVARKGRHGLGASNIAGSLSAEILDLTFEKPTPQLKQPHGQQGAPPQSSSVNAGKATSSPHSSIGTVGMASKSGRTGEPMSTAPSSGPCRVGSTMRVHGAALIPEWMDVSERDGM